MSSAPAVAVPSLHHVTLRTTRKSELIEWYGVVAGLTVVHEFPFGAWLTNDAANHRVAVLAFPEFGEDPEKLAHGGLDHIAFEYDTFAELLDTYDRLRDEGITPKMCLDHGMTFSLYYSDPDGNAVELQVDGQGGWEHSTAYMRDSPDFHANPLGKFFEPEAVLSAYRTGTTFEEIRREIERYRPDPLPDVPFALPPGA